MEPFLSTICEICEKPTFLCVCVIDSLQKCHGKSENGVVYTNISVSTMTVCFNFNNEINLKVLNESFPKGVNVSYKPGSKKSKVPKKKGTDSFYNSFDIKMSLLDRESGLFSNVSIFIFPNGKVKAAGAKNINTINILIEEIIEIIKYVPGSVVDPETLCAENIKIQMICSDFKIKPIKDDPDGWCLKQEELKNILVNGHSLSATFSALSRYPGINLKYPSFLPDNKPVSLLIFRSGSIIITGAKNTKDILNSYNFITNLIINNRDKLFYYDINEEIKQKKKKKLNVIK
jgi:TATA-box binding protein (TBP) (component of TFIID and TFIIIB)